MTATAIHGALIVHKPVSITSSDCVTRIKHALINNNYTDKKIRIGHGGTLDPFATGVLIVLFGEATKLADTYLHSQKSYSGIISLGTQTSTADHTGEVTLQADIPHLSQEEWQSLAQSFVTEDYFQTPPMYSAKKKEGIALHQLARKGVEIERAPILKKIFRFDVTLAAGELRFEVDCESGTYVRTLAEDLAKKAGTVAHLKTLCRDRSSDCKIQDAISLDSLIHSLSEKTPLENISAFRSLDSLGSHLPKMSVTMGDAEGIRHGKIRFTDDLCVQAAQQFPKHQYILAKLGENPVALLAKTDRSFRVQRVFNG